MVVYATGSIVGDVLAPTPMLATLPLSIFVVGMAACILPMGAIARRHGRRAAFLAGTGAGVLAGLLAMLAVVLGAFWLFCLGTFFGGGYAAVVLSFRFAAADGVAPQHRARALSFVMAGGVAAGVVGPQLVTRTMELWPPHLFAATYLAQAVAAALSAFVLLGVRLPMPTVAEKAGGRPLALIARQPLGRLDDIAYPHPDRVMTRLLGALTFPWRDARRGSRAETRGRRRIRRSPDPRWPESRAWTAHPAR